MLLRATALLMVLFAVGEAGFEVERVVVDTGVGVEQRHRRRVLDLERQRQQVTGVGAIFW